MTNTELDSWFCSLTIKQKEHIASKILLKDGKDPKDGTYPGCTDVWSSLGDGMKEKIYAHCTDDHGMWIKEGGNAPIFSF